jgi:hypothetical protein
MNDYRKSSISLVLNGILLFLFSVNFLCYGAVGIKFSGKADFSLRYTPENNWEGWDELLINSVVESGTNAKLLLSFGENSTTRGERYFWWENNRERRFGFFIDKAYLSYIGQLYHNAPESNVIIGDLSFSYHPYFLKLDNWDEGEYLSRDFDQTKRGILLKDLNLGSFKLGGFYLWDGDGDASKRAIGYRATKELLYGGFEINAISFQIQGDSGNVEKQDTLGILVNQTIAESIVLNGVFGFMDTKGKEGFSHKLTSRLMEIEGVYKVDENVSIKLAFIDFPMDFDPIYRDRTPKFNPRTGEILKWNNLDRYLDQKGIRLTIHYADPKTAIKAILANYCDHNLDYPTNTGEINIIGEIKLPGRFDLTNKHRLEKQKYRRAGQTFNERLYYSNKFAISRPILNDRATLRYFHAKRLSSSEYIFQELAMRNQEGKGMLAGSDLCFGIRKTSLNPNGVYPFLEFESKLPWGLDFVLRWSKENRIENMEFEYDEDDGPIIIDNLFGIRTQLKF